MRNKGPTQRRLGVSFSQLRIFKYNLLFSKISLDTSPLHVETALRTDSLQFKLPSQNLSKGQDSLHSVCFLTIKTRFESGRQCQS